MRVLTVARRPEYHLQRYGLVTVCLCFGMNGRSAPLGIINAWPVSLRSGVDRVRSRLAPAHAIHCLVTLSTAEGCVLQ